MRCFSQYLISKYLRQPARNGTSWNKEPSTMDLFSTENDFADAEILIKALYALKNKFFPVPLKL